MARETVIRFIDDLDGTEIPDGEHNVVSFSYKGKDYEIDLSDENSAAFDEAMARFVEAAHEIGKARAAGQKTTTKKADKEHLAAIRAWVREQGWPISDRGRIKEEYVTAYEEAQSNGPRHLTSVPSEEAPEQLTIDDSHKDEDADTDRPSDEVVLAWWKEQDYKEPKNGKVTGLHRKRYLDAHAG